MSCLPATPQRDFKMPTSIQPARGIISRLDAFSSWLDTGAYNSSGGELSFWREESEHLASVLQREKATLSKLYNHAHRISSPGRLRASLSLLISCIHSPDAAVQLPDGIMEQLQHTAVVWIMTYLDSKPDSSLPSGMQLAVAEVLLRARLLQGCSRQLASATAAVATDGQEMPCAWPGSQEEEEVLEGASMLDVLSCTVCLLHPLAKVCTVRSPARAPAQQAMCRAAAPCRPSEAQTDAVEVGGRAGEGRKGRHAAQASEEQAVVWQGQGGLQGQGTACGAAPPANMKQQLVAAVDDSSVLEHVARGVLLQAAWLQRMQQAGRQHGQEHDGLHDMLHSRLSLPSNYFASLYSLLTKLSWDPELQGVSDPACSDRNGVGAEAQAHGAAAAPAPTQQDGPRHVFEASTNGLHAAHVSSLRRVLSGPCARHLVLCQGLRTLCALDGGGDYGMPEAAGLQNLPVCGAVKREDQQSQPVRIKATPLVNLVNLLATRPDAPGAGAKAEPPGRGTRLQLTLRVALTAVGAKAGAGGSRAQGRPCYALQQADGACAAVYALHCAWRHMPPPHGRLGADRRRAALRRWAAAVEQVVRSGVVAAEFAGLQQANDLGQVLRLHPSMAGPLGRQDLAAVVSGGHLLRASEWLVGQVVRDCKAQAHEDQSRTAGGIQPPTATALALWTLIDEHSCDTWPRPLRGLLLQPGEDEQLGAEHGGESAGRGGQEQGQDGVTGRVGVGSEGLRAAVSLVVALGKLILHFEGGLAGALGGCSDNVADGGTDLAKLVMWAVCDVLWVGARGAGKGGGQPESGWEVRRRVWVSTFGAWRWLPTLANVARRATAGRFVEDVDDVSLQPWWACLDWVRRLCLAVCSKHGCMGLGLGAWDGDGEGAGNGAAAGTAVAAAACAMPRGATADTTCGTTPHTARQQQGRRCSRGCSCGCSCGGGGGAHGGCWRQFLLRDVGVVGLLGAAMNDLLPLLFAWSDDKHLCQLLEALAEACVLTAVAFPAEVARDAWGPHGGAAGGTGGGGSAASGVVWSPIALNDLAFLVDRAQEGRPLAGALHALAEWGVECVWGNGAAEPSAELRQLLAEAVADVGLDTSGTGEGMEQGAMLLPSLCELRALLRVCCNPRCAVLPPPGEAEAEAAGGLEASSGGCGAAWYCCRECREEHGG